jgi:hypothetical protein
MMFANVTLAQMIAKERMQKAVREAQHARLAREAQSPKKGRGGLLSAALTLSRLLALRTQL